MQTDPSFMSEHQRQQLQYGYGLEAQSQAQAPYNQYGLIQANQAQPQNISNSSIGAKEGNYRSGSTSSNTYIHQNNPYQQNLEENPYYGASVRTEEPPITTMTATGDAADGDQYSSIYQQHMTQSEVHLAKISDQEERIKQEIREERKRMEA